MKVKATVKNTLKGSGTEQRGGDTKILKRETSWVKLWVPLKRGLEPPYELWLVKPVSYLGISINTQSN